MPAVEVLYKTVMQYLLRSEEENAVTVTEQPISSGNHGVAPSGARARRFSTGQHAGRNFDFETDTGRIAAAAGTTGTDPLTEKTAPGTGPARLQHALGVMHPAATMAVIAKTGSRDA